MNPIIKPRPFRGWAMEFVGKIMHSSSNEHTFIIIATNYFTKWVEAKALNTISSAAVITFIKQQIIHRFEIQETIFTEAPPSFQKKSRILLGNTTSNWYSLVPIFREQMTRLNLLKKYWSTSSRKWRTTITGTGTKDYPRLCGQIKLLRK